VPERVLTSSARIEHAIIPVRRFDAAAASRINVQKLSTGESDGQTVPGGLWGTDKANQQADVLRLKFAKLIEVLVHHDIPVTFLSYPRLVRDPDYLYTKLKFLLSDVDHAAFRTAFQTTVRPDWIHQFTADDR
jgi:hypothetical protein